LSAPGFVALFRDGQELWDEQEVVVLQTVAAALSNTFAREELFNQVQQTLSETEALYRGGAALSEASTYQEILDVLLGNTVLGEQSNSATLQIFDRPWVEDQMPAYADVVAYWSNDGNRTIQQRYMVEEFPSALDVMRDGTPLFIEDLSQDNILDRRAHALFRRALGARSLVIVPLVVGGQRVGYLHTDFRIAKRFPESVRRRLISLAQQAAIAVLNIRQLQASEARVRREQLIREVTGRIQASTDVRGVLQVAVRELGRAFGTSHNRIQFHPSRTDEDQDAR
jgi:GAF domain-containing protein